jgi:cupin superfamily acireductone dioxygenase involved in methionine salvage
MVGMEILKEITHWQVDFAQPNHTYLINNKNQIIAYAKYNSNKIEILKSRHVLDKRYRKFVTDNHIKLSELIPKYISEDIKKEDNKNDYIPKNSRVFKVKSKEKIYTVILNNNRYTCTCIGFEYRRKCRHVDAVVKKQQPYLTSGMVRV